MPQLLQTDNGELLLLYPLSGHLFFQRHGREGLTRPTLLADDYASDLNAVIDQGELYYSYLSNAGELKLCILGQSAPLWATTECDPHLFSPGFYAFRDKLLFLFATGEIREPSIQPAALQLILPHETASSPTQLLSLEGILNVTPAESKKDLYLLLVSDHDTALFGMDQSLQLSECKSRELEHLQEENQALSQTIESIKAQYEELMDVALQYRQEAQKWYQKYIRS